MTIDYYAFGLLRELSPIVEQMPCKFVPFDC